MIGRLMIGRQSVIDRLTRKPAVLVLVLAAASTVLVCGSRVWVSGAVDDVVLGPGALRGTGSDVAPGALAAALVGLASAVVVATAGSVVRVVAACSALMAAVLGSAVVVSVLADPGAALGKLAASGTGRSGTLAAHGGAESWAWVTLAAMLVMGVGAVGALVGGRNWRGLPGRYEVGVPPAGDDSAWEQLSLGEDPTAEP